MSLLHVTKRVHSELYNESETSFVNKFILKKTKTKRKTCLTTFVLLHSGFDIEILLLFHTRIQTTITTSHNEASRLYENVQFVLDVSKSSSRDRCHYTPVCLQYC